jgi:hypothetical protein
VHPGHHWKLQPHVRFLDSFHQLPCLQRLLAHNSKEEPWPWQMCHPLAGRSLQEEPQDEAQTVCQRRLQRPQVRGQTAQAQAKPFSQRELPWKSVQMPPQGMERGMVLNVERAVPYPLPPDQQVTHPSCSITPSPRSWLLACGAERLVWVQCSRRLRMWCCCDGRAFMCSSGPRGVLPAHLTDDRSRAVCRQTSFGDEWEATKSQSQAHKHLL